MSGSAVIVNHRVILPSATEHNSIGGSRVLYIANRPGAVTMKTPDDLRIEVENERMTKLGYIGFRPGSVPERNAGHALFDQCGVPARAEIQRELKATQGSVITSVVSVRREDAAALNLTTKQDWERLIRSQWLTHVEKMNVIAPENVRYVAAMHINDTSYHVHVFTWDKSGEFRGLIPKKNLVEAQGSFAEESLRPQRETLSLKRREARDELVRLMKEPLNVEERQKLNESLPEQCSLKYGSLEKHQPEARQAVDDIVAERSRQPQIQDQLNHYMAIVEEQATLQGLKGADLEAYQNAAEHDIKNRLGNAVISSYKTDPPIPAPEYRPEIFNANEASIAEARKQERALGEEIDSFLSPKEQEQVRVALSSGNTEEAAHYLAKTPTFKESMKDTVQALKASVATRFDSIRRALSSKVYPSTLQSSHQAPSPNPAVNIARAVKDAVSRLTNQSESNPHTEPIPQQNLGVKNVLNQR